MSLSEILLPEFDQEMAVTRRVLERVPEDRLAWQPHPKSMSLGRLATHVAELPGWSSVILKQDFFDLAPQGGGSYKPQTLGNRGEILELFDANVAKTRTVIEGAEDDAFRQPWSLKRGGEAIFTLPRAAVLRSMLFSHIIHHRGQLSVYLRLNEVPVPSIYGPSADEAA